jgi:hypothetical protein
MGQNPGFLEDINNSQCGGQFRFDIAQKRTQWSHFTRRELSHGWKVVVLAGP